MGPFLPKGIQQIGHLIPFVVPLKTTIPTTPFVSRQEIHQKLTSRKIVLFKVIHDHVLATMQFLVFRVNVVHVEQSSLSF